MFRPCLPCCGSHVEQRTYFRVWNVPGSRIFSIPQKLLIGLPYSFTLSYYYFIFTTFPLFYYPSAGPTRWSKPVCNRGSGLYHFHHPTFRVNSSGSSLSSPPHLQPYTKPFSGRPARPYMTCPTREAGGALRERFGIVYPLLPLAQRPDTNVAIDAALPEAAAVGRQALPPTVVEIGTTSQPQTEPSRKPSRKRHRNRSARVFRLPKR